MKIKYAQRVTEKILIDLIPYCKRIEVAGSVRRGKPDDIKDIEFVAIPKYEMQPDIYSNMRQTDVNALFTHVRKRYDVVSGGKKGQRMVTMTVCENVTVELYMATPETYGYILAIRTGPAELSKLLVTNLKIRGYLPSDGKIERNGELVPVKFERTVFGMAGVPYREPVLRHA